ncbi:MAG: hypothetical protein ACR5KV_00115 [Wolbachia sp.]
MNYHVVKVSMTKSFLTLKMVGAITKMSIQRFQTFNQIMSKKRVTLALRKMRKEETMNKKKSGKLQENGSLEDSLTDIKTNDSGYSSPTYTSHYNFQVDPEQLKVSLTNVKQGNLTEFTSKLNKETQKFPLKPVNQKEMNEQTKERLLEAGLLKDSSIDIKIATERENNDTNSTIDKNSKLYKLLEKDITQLKTGVIEEEREDALTEHIDSPDRNRVALTNKNRKLLWIKRIAGQQEKDDDISI